MTEGITLKEVQAKIDKIVNNKELSKLYDLRSRLQEEEDKNQLRRLIGKCYKFLNSSSGQEKWWLYRKIIELPNNEIATLDLEQTSYGSFSVNTNEIWSDSYLERYTEISREEYDRATKPIVRILLGMCDK